MATEAIAAVNHWRGQCLDNFARAERAIIAAYDTPLLRGLAKPPVLHEAAAQRTRALATALRTAAESGSAAVRAAARLEAWGLREKQRNRLVHGCFNVKGSDSTAWWLVIVSVEIKKGLAVTTQTPLSQAEAAAFLSSVIAERKDLEAALKAVGAVIV